MKRLSSIILIVFLLISCDSTEDKTENTKTNTIMFSVIGDVPYGTTQRDGLINLIEKHNAQNDSEFVVHVGDIKKGSEPCDENAYIDINAILKKFTVPTFIVLGDNEYNDCDNPNQAFIFWKSHFLKFHENWNFPYPITYQTNRTENFSWVQDKILFIGLNIVGSSVHDENEWQKRLTDNGNWVKQLLEIHKKHIEATVIFAHANIIEAGSKKFEPFTNLFKASAKTFEKPILFLNGDGHFWIKNNPWEEKNITRVQINGGVDALKVIINPNLENPFSFDNSFLD
ncbi:hypothetical protein EGM88_06195 [Aureibaculum marinum]|uniref:Calcineurin-like phosphoesterase domain-containing protein n=1 Tax=Aureibaculum marinum TaxID=2487930 RepID=A0A3N4NVP3_9FLAO|nr:metallophosphoesterase [Aureibaculum marinum]RPD98777.1 hypothetical protein EGM88_06195 [Aureibaculum marinum]